MIDEGQYEENKEIKRRKKKEENKYKMKKSKKEGMKK